MGVVLIIGLAAASAFAQTISINTAEPLVQLVQSWAAACVKQHPEVRIEVKAVGTDSAFDNLQTRKVALIVVPRSIKFKEAQACEAVFGKRPVEYRVGVNGVTVYVNAENPIKVLSYEELEAVFCGKYTNWKQVGGNNAPIAVYCREKNSAPAELFKDEVLNGKELVANAQSRPGSDLLKAIAADRNGIGYGPLNELRGTRVLAIKRAISSTPVAPSSETISNRTYPISRYLYEYVNPAEDKGEINAFAAWIRTDEGQRCVQQAGYYPLPLKLRVTR